MHYNDHRIPDGSFKEQLRVHREIELIAVASCEHVFHLLSLGLFALHRKIWFGVCKKIENFVITNFFVFVIAFALETC